MEGRLEGGGRNNSWEIERRCLRGPDRDQSPGTAALGRRQKPPALRTHQ